jgi:5,10-methylene-tetrahydrofolate dehydrogenase/methenyl tetrahydrofolate cyclohydrolase
MEMELEAEAPGNPVIFNGKELAARIISKIVGKDAFFLFLLFLLFSFFADDLKGYMERPCLVVLTLGSRKDVESFVRSKQREAKLCGKKVFFFFFFLLAVSNRFALTGIEVIVKHFEPNISEEELLKEIDIVNRDPTIDGILLQLPLPAHIHDQTICQSLSYEKDVDSLHKENIGLLAIPTAEILFTPCTALSVIKILEESGITLNGATACIIGASANVGIPLMLLLIRRGVTVTISHIFTKDLVAASCNADIVVSAAGVANLVTAEHVKEGAIVVDVGINFVADGSRTSGFRLCGDVDFNSVKKKCKFITPVPNGVGPVTSAVVLSATAEAFKKFRKKDLNKTL